MTLSWSFLFEEHSVFVFEKHRICLCVCSFPYLTSCSVVVTLADTQFTAQNTLVVIILPLHAVGDKHPTYQTHIIHTLTSVTVLLQLVKKETALEGIGYSCS